MLLLTALMACRHDDHPGACKTWGPEQTWLDNTMPAAIQQAFEAELAALDGDGVAWAILVDGEIRYAGAAGIKDRQGQLPMEPHTLLRSGSTLKMQTAAMVLSLEAEGLVSRDDTLGDLLPDFSMRADPGVAEQATLHELLSHQGGFVDYTPIDGPTGDVTLYNQVHDVFARDGYMLVEPGSFYNYSNPNFVVAALAGQEAAGVPYATLMRERIWEPLCMTRTTLEPADALADGEYATARGVWDANGEQRVEPDSYDSGFSRPAGFAFTSTMDMLRFAHFLMEGNEDVMPKAMSDAITTAHVDTLEIPGAGLQYGYGMFLYTAYGRGQDWVEGPLWGHGGDIPGFAADLFVHPGTGVALAVLANASGAHFVDAPMAVFRELSGVASTPPPDDGLPNDPADYVGTFDESHLTGRLVFSVVDGELYVDAPEIDAADIPYEHVLQPLWEDAYLFDAQNNPIAVTFARDATGEVRWLRHRAFVASKVDDVGIAKDEAPRPPIDARALRDALTALRL
ncbi:MAG: beta-lactamase family protein [Myxococcales bacterium]|nr:beta-lactamase family protein [Myxococcales bacterium]